MYSFVAFEIPASDLTHFFLGVDHLQLAGDEKGYCSSSSRSSEDNMQGSVQQKASIIIVSL